MCRIFHAYSRHSRTWSRVNWDAHPVRVLVSFTVLQHYLEDAARFNFRPAATMLDSGAFSAWNSKRVIDAAALADEQRSGRWGECVALDVIGDWRGSRANAFEALRDGRAVMPVFHFGEPFALLAEYCAAFPKVGLSCRFGETHSEAMRWVGQCFARCWPHRFHSFGWIGRRPLLAFPFDSADAISWQMGNIMGVWHAFDRKVKTRQNVTAVAQFTFFHRLELEVAGRWHRELKSVRENTSGGRRKALSRS